MKGYFTLILAIFAVAAPQTFAQTKSTKSTPANALEQQIIDLERERLKAFAQDDKASFERLVTDDVTITHTSGGVSNKADLLSVMRRSTPDRPLPALSIEDAKVRIYGDTAIMIGNLVETASDGRRVWVLCFTNTYVKQGKGWRLAAGQLTTLSHERASIKVDPKIYDNYIGQYRNPSGRVRTIVREGDRIMTESGGQKLQLFPAAVDQFFVKEADVMFVFVKDSQGKVIRLINRRPNGDVIQEDKVN